MERKWELPYPYEELHVRVICGDPIAVIYDQLQQWVSSQGYKPKLDIEELVECLWFHHYGNSMTRYTIIRDNNRGMVFIMDELPTELIKASRRMFEGK